MSLWTTQQHEWLQALGHPVLLLAGDPALAEPAVAPDPVQIPPAAHPVRDAAPRAGSPDPASARHADERAASHSPARRPRQAPVANPVEVAPSTGAAVPRPPTDVAAKKAALEEARRAGQRARPPEPVPVDPLLAAVLRVSGRDADPAEEVLAMLDIDLDRLRSDPLAKRALWVRLRALRRGRDG
ncbi:MAG TPA: hypothetical protein VFS82_01960 [Lysobacter sp.]|nr:hypothetical protein [Lysobacter sp.]